MDWQRGLRRQFGREQAFGLENLGSEPFFSEFRISNPVSKSGYRVAIRGLGPGGNFCSCPDYATSELGTCKHLEFTLARLQKKRGARTAFARGYEKAMPEGVAAMVGALLLFVLPVDWRSRKFTLTWDEAVRIDWGIVLLYGGGLAMGALAFSTGLADAMGRGITAWLPTKTSFALTTIFTGAAILLSEATSNTAAANMIVPVAIAVAQAAGIRPIEPALGATLGASMGFMMPISTAPNAIVYSSGFVPITAMMRYGVVLDIIAFVLIVATVTIAAPMLIP